MNYKNIYQSIISGAKTNIKLDYYENHHIVPKCMGGSNKKDNIVSLTYREHFICHWLLCKIYPDNFKVKAAFGKMLETTKSKQRIVNSRHFDIVKRQLKNIYYPWLAAYMKKNGPWNKVKVGSQIAWNKGLKTGPVSSESNIKRSMTLKEKFSNTEHHLKGVDPWNKGKVGSQIAWNKGITPPKIACVHCGLAVSPTNMKRWHGDKCKVQTNTAAVVKEYAEQLNRNS